MQGGEGGSPALPITSRCPAQARAEEAEKHRALQNGRLKRWGAEPPESCSPAQGQGKALRPTRKTSGQLGAGLPCTDRDVWLQIQGKRLAGTRGLSLESPSGGWTLGKEAG